MKRFRFLTAIVTIAIFCFLMACGDTNPGITSGDTDNVISAFTDWNSYTSSEGFSSIDLDDVPTFDGATAWVVVNNNLPFFTDEEITTDVFETYSELDSLGRCGIAYANICQELMPTEPRGEIGQVKPSGWGHNNKYASVDGGYIWNRCHLIGFQLAGENANEKNLITGTRYLNIEGMLPFEDMVADYVHKTNNHVLYRVTPIYDGNNLIADGVLMEGWSVEDNGGGVCFNVYAYNCQPGIEINYITGDNWETTTSSGSDEIVIDVPANSDSGTQMEYVLNTNSKKIHYPDCESAVQTSEKNKKTVTGTRDNLIAQGYTPCGVCKP